MDYITWTYYFRRLAKNPGYYGLADISNQTVAAHISALILSTLGDLFEAGCVAMRQDGRNFAYDATRSLASIFDTDIDRSRDVHVVPTTIGRICSFYYLNFKTGLLFNTTLAEDSSYKDVLKTMTEATEFKQIPVRHNEDKLNIELSKEVRYRIDEQCADSPNNKAYLLLQSHFGRINLPISDYVTDQKTVLENCMRVIQGLVDLVAYKGYLHTTIKAIHIHQSVVQASWWDTPSLLNFGFPSTKSTDILNLFKSHSITSFAHLVHKTSSEIDKFTSDLVSQHKELDLTKEFVNTLHSNVLRLPRLHIECNLLSSIDNSSAESSEPRIDTQSVLCSIEVTIVRDTPYRKAVTPHYPKPKDEQFWVLLGHEPTGELLAIKKVMNLKSRTSTTLCCSLNRDWIHHSKQCKLSGLPLQVILMCDSYIGLDQQYTVHLPYEQL